MLSHQTRVYTPDGFAKIRNLKIGCEIISMNDSGKMITTQISEIQKVYVVKEGLLCLRFDHMQKPVYCSSDQEFFYGDGSKVSAERLEVGDQLKGLHHQIFRLNTKERIENQETLDKFHREGDDYVLYNIRMSNDENTFFLNTGLMAKAVSYKPAEVYVDVPGNAYVNYMENR